MKHIFLIFVVTQSVNSCLSDYSASGGGLVGSGIKTIWTGGFSGQNGVTMFGQIDVLQDQSSLQETFEIHNDFIVSGVSGTIQFWLSDNNGAANLNSAIKKILVDSLVSNYSGAHNFTVPAGNKSSDYTYVVVFGSNPKKNIGNAKLVLPTPSE